MFSSGVTAEVLIRELQNEVDIALPISEETYLQWLSSLEQLLYSEVIQEQKAYTPIVIVLYDDESLEDRTPRVVEYNPSKWTEVQTKNEFEAIPKPEDIYTIFVNGVQLIKSTVTSGELFSNTWFIENEKLKVYVNGRVAEIKFIYFVRPRIKDSTTKADMVWVPYEFLDLVKAKLRGEAYKLANEDVIAAKWINDYNALLSSFQEWIARRKAQFGM